MPNNNYLCLINFKVKKNYRQTLFKNEHVAGCSIFLNIQHCIHF